MTSLSPRTVLLPSQDCTILESSWHLLKDSMDIDLHVLEHDCFSDIGEVMQDSSCDLLNCDSSSITFVTHDFDDPCVFMLDSQDSLEDLSPPGIIDHDLVASATFNVSCSTDDVFQLFPTDHVVDVVVRDTYSTSPAPVDFDPAYAIFLHDTVHAWGIFNYEVCRLPVPSGLNIPLCRTLLANYEDNIVCDYLEFGWPKKNFSSH